MAPGSQIGGLLERCESPLAFDVDLDLAVDDVMVTVLLSGVTLG